MTDGTPDRQEISAGYKITEHEDACLRALSAHMRKSKAWLCRHKTMEEIVAEGAPLVDAMERAAKEAA